jgi:hypothetical protein
MDIGPVVAALGLHSAQLQQTIAMRILKMTAQAEADAVRTLLSAPAAPPTAANPASGVGGALDITA